MTVDRSDRMADAVPKTYFRPRTVRPFLHLEIFLDGWGASVKQQVVRLGMILAALQFAGEACWAQSRAADELFPRGSLFPCAAYSVGSGPVLQAHADLQRFRPSGFNLLGPQYGLNKTVLQDAEAHGLRAIYTVGADVDFLQEKGLPKPIDKLAADVTAQVSKVAPDRTIAWWYLAQEELRTWRRDEMLYLERITEAIRNADPLRRPILMYDAGHRSSAEIALTGRYLDFAAKGSYVNYSGNVDRRAWLAVSIQQEVEAARQAPRKLSPLLIPEMFQNAPAGRSDQIGRWVRHDVVRGLIEGASGLLIFSFGRRANFEDYEAYFSAYRTITPILCGAGELGQALLFGENIPAAMVDISNGPQDLSIEAFGKTTSVPAVGLRAIRHHGAVYVLLANSTDKEISGSLKGLPVDEPVWSLTIPSIGPALLKKTHFVLGPWGALVVKAPLPK
jgi:hypothetical protein